MEINPHHKENSSLDPVNMEFRQPDASLGTTPLPIHLRTVGLSLKVLVPNLPLSYLTGGGLACRPYSDYVHDLIAWKNAALPPQDEAKTMRQSLVELEAIELGFPGIDDGAFVLALAAHLVYTCVIDDVFETLNVKKAEECAGLCISALAGQAIEHPAIAVGSDVLDGIRMSKSYHNLLISTLKPRAAAAILRDVQAMITGQLPERRHNVNSEPLTSCEHYLNLREQPLGVLPLLTIIEHYALANDEPEYKDIQLFKSRIVRLAIVQNDLGGIEKDIATSNRSNVVIALGELTGRQIWDKADIIASRDILHSAELEHNRLLSEVMESWEDINGSPCTETKTRMSQMMITLTVTHLQWTLATKRYAVEGLEVAKKY